jgi:hypothetical protein
MLLPVLRRMVPTIGLLIVAALLFGCREQPPPEPEHLLSLNHLSMFENYTLLHLDSAWVVWASSKQLDNGAHLSEVVAYRLDKQAWKEAFRQRLPDAYNARLEIRTDFRYRGQPTALLRVQFGAAFERQEVYGVDAGVFRRVQALNAGMFAWTYTDASSLPMLVGIPGGASDPVIYYRWDQGLFREVPSEGK